MCICMTIVWFDFCIIEKEQFISILHHKSSEKLNVTSLENENWFLFLNVYNIQHTTYNTFFHAFSCYWFHCANNFLKKFNLCQTKDCFQNMKRVKKRKIQKLEMQFECFSLKYHITVSWKSLKIDFENTITWKTFFWGLQTKNWLNLKMENFVELCRK